MILCIPLFSFSHVNEIWLNPHRKLQRVSFFVGTGIPFSFLPRFVSKIYFFLGSFMPVYGPVLDKPFLDLIYGPKKKRSHFGQLFFLCWCLRMVIIVELWYNIVTRVGRGGGGGSSLVAFIWGVGP